ncbi:protein AGENET DOMAIN (AGD)-CONTAINING P1-like [Argentina anserina]|uniref:protein AGENET DOMAIN (AGD)-CONTAINING P1-like n=1 Tax=Argentina anserina TaxID=57926 RepID=UPI00217620E8|nr:protein AGENET DOMAIN (AGD)-CONTAINING P1-like [Potentilla anserina]
MAFHSEISFQRGGEVEVCSKVPEYIGSYFEATIVARKGNNYVVQYKNLVEEYDESVPLKEKVMADEVRPLPPEVTEATEFHVGTRVDAYDLDGWWVGTIYSERNVYGYHLVFFETTGEVLPYSLRELRVHQEWRNGKWDVSSTKRKRLPLML